MMDWDGLFLRVDNRRGEELISTSNEETETSRNNWTRVKKWRNEK